jgi:hypothetical protein
MSDNRSGLGFVDMEFWCFLSLIYIYASGTRMAKEKRSFLKYLGLLQHAIKQERT